MEHEILLKEPSTDITARIRYRNILSILENYNIRKVLDIGPRNDFDKMVEDKFNIKIENTTGDLDEDFTAPNADYDTILYLMVMEHQFNPLYTLLRLKDIMINGGIIILNLPSSGKLLWTPIHFHELDEYRVRMMVSRAGLKIAEKYKFKSWRKWTAYLKGIRPLYRLFREYDVVYVLERK